MSAGDWPYVSTTVTNTPWPQTNAASIVYPWQCSFGVWHYNGVCGCASFSQPIPDAVHEHHFVPYPDYKDVLPSARRIYCELCGAVRSLEA